MTIAGNERSEMPCPICAEQILVSARKCRYCGEWIDHQAANTANPIHDQSHGYGAPYRFERQEKSTSQGGQQYTATTVAFAVQGDVCPSCKVANFTNEYSVWHWLLAIFFFPLGLLVLLFPIKTCTRCRLPFGAGKKMAETIQILAAIYLSLIALLVLGVCAAAIAAA